jgi:hypothetical protein
MYSFIPFYTYTYINRPTNKFPLLKGESSHSSTPGVIYATPHRNELPSAPAPTRFLATRTELPADAKEPPKPSAELPTTEYR